MKTLLSAIIAALLALFGLHQSLAHTTAPTASPVAATYESGPASLAAAASSIDGAQVSSSTNSNETSAQASVEKVSASANEVSLNSPVIERVFENAPLVQTDFVTQDELSAQLLQLSNALTAKLDSTSTPYPPQNIGADGNGEIPYAAENAINSLSDVTISNATISNSNVSGSGNGNDLPLSGGTITGDVAVDGNASTTNLSATTLSVTSTSTLAAIVLSTLNCSTYGNGGKLTTDGLGNVICAADQGGAGSTVAGANDQVQFNGFGAFDASSAFTFATSTGILTTPALSSTNASTTLATFGTVWLPSITNAIISTNASGQVVATTTLGSNLLSVPSNSLLAGNNSGQLVATTSIGTSLLTGTLGIGNGGTGISTTPSYGQLLFGNGSGGYSLVATSSLGISGGSGTVTSITAGSGLSGGTITTSGTVSLNLANANDWTALQQFTNASSSLLSVFGPAYFGATATSSFNAAGQLSLVSNGLNVGSGQLIVSGGNVGIGTTTPGSLLSLGGIANFTTATSTFYSSGGINLTSGCFSINGTCLTSGGGNSFGYLFPSNATSTTLTFNSGLLSLASTTIGTGTQADGLTINGGATTTGNALISGALNVTGKSTLGNASTTVLSVSGNSYLGTGQATTFAINSILSCSGSEALQTDGSGNVTCSTVSSGGASAGGGWLASGGSSNGSITEATSTYLVAVGATSTPYAKFSILSGSAATTTLALVPASSQTADILDIYNTSGALGSVFTAGGSLGLGTTSPGSILSIIGVGNFVANATSTLQSGLNITSGCFSVNGTCVGTGSGSSNVSTSSQNTWSALQLFTGGASTTQLSVFNTAWFGATATSSFNSTGQLSLVSNGLNVGSGQLIVSGGNVGTGTTTPGSLLSLGGIANFTTATSTFYSSGGINLAGGCFSVNGTCISGGGGGGSGTVSSGTQGEFAFYNTSGTTVSGTSTISITQAGNIGIGTTTPSSLLSVGGNLNVQTDSASALNVENTAGTSSLQVSTLNSSSNLFEVGSSTGSIYLSVTAGGDVGIGTTSPTHTLSVWGAGANGFFDLSSTTSGDIFDVATNGNVGIGTTTPGSLLSINGVGNFVANATSTLYGGLNITSGCFSVNGTCVGGNGGSSASSTLLSDNNTFSGIDSFTNASANFAGTWQGFSPSHFDTFAYLFPSNATSTTLTFSGGLLSLASSTIGNDTQAGGLTIAGGATTTLNAYFGGNVGIGTSTPGSLLSLNNIANFTTATSTFYSSGGINLAGGCFSVNGTCISGGGGGGSGTVNSGTQGQFAFYNATGTTLSGTSTLFVSQAGLIGIGTTSPYAALSIFAGGDYGSHKASTLFAIGSTTAGTATTTLFSINSTGVVNLNPASQAGDLVANFGGTSFLTASSSAGNIALGFSALSSNVSGSGDTALGSFTLFVSTSSSDNTAIGDNALSSVDDAAGNSNTAVGYRALREDMTGAANDAMGNSALESNTTGNNNDAMGDSALSNNTTGNSNVAIGFSSLTSNTTGNNNVAFGGGSLHGSNGSGNTAFGESSLFDNVTGNDNVAGGYNSLKYDAAATGTVALGAFAGSSNVTGAAYANQGGTYVGQDAGLSLGNNSNYNTLLGYGAGSAITTGANNIFIGPDTTADINGNSAGTNNTLTSGSGNISIGYDLTLASSTGSNQLDIGNILFGTGLTGTGSTIAGDVGIGTSTPYGRLEIWGPDTASTSPLTVVNSASTTVLAVFDNGNANLSGNLIQNSDERLKTNIQSLDASTSLSLISQLNPVTFNWIDPEKGTTPQLGFIAQQVQQVFPNLVSTTSPTSLTPDGTLSLNYIGLISPIVSALQQLSADITSIENTIAGFAEQFTTSQLTFTRANGQELCLDESNGQQVCVTGDQLAALLSAANASQSSGSSDTSAPDTPSDDATDTPPQIQINGDNPAIVQFGATYEDLGTTITGPQQDLNLGIQTFVNGVAMSPVQIDTSEAATDTIDYVVTDQNGLTSTSTRTVIVELAETPQSPQSEQDTTSDTATSSSTTTNSTSTPATTTPQQQINTAASSTDATSTQQ